mgnify:CR=1 FL=1|tara:strand:+ start:1016 stop:2689 length:1674 start_codon:yes stop_codon:yes gene_type:complete
MSLPDQEEQKNWYEQLKSKFTTADAVWLAGTGLIAALNPKGIKGQAKVIKDDLELSKKMGANLVTNANKVISQETLPKMEEVEKEKAELLEFINADLQGFGEGASPVRNPFIMALVQSGPAYWRAFRDKLKKHNQWRTKTTASGGGGMQSLTAAEIESAFGDGTSILERYKDAPTDALSIDQWSDYIDKRYKDWESYIDRSGASTSAEAGIFAEMYAPSVGAMSERDRLLAMLPGRNVGNEYFSMDDLFAISQSATDFGIPSNELIPVEGGYDFRRTAPNPFFDTVDDIYIPVVNEMLNTMSIPNSKLNNAIKANPNDAINYPFPNENKYLGVFGMMKKEKNDGSRWWEQPQKLPWNGSIDKIKEQMRILDDNDATNAPYYKVLQKALEVASSNPIIPLIYSQAYANRITDRNQITIENRTGANDDTGVVAINIDVDFSGDDLKAIYQDVRDSFLTYLETYKKDNTDEKRTSASSVLDTALRSRMDNAFMSPETIARFLEGMGVRELPGGGYTYAGLHADDTFSFYGNITSDNTTTLFQMTLDQIVNDDMFGTYFKR